MRGLVIALALVVGATAWIATREGEGEPASPPVPGEARTVNEEELAGVAATAGHPVYWAGPIEDTELEVTENADGSVLVRYLEDGAGAGEGTAAFLAVGSYPLPDPTRALNGFARRPGAIVRRSAGLGKVVTEKPARTSVYFSGPDNSVQVEVYDPSPRRAMSLTLSGRIQPVG